MRLLIRTLALACFALAAVSGNSLPTNAKDAVVPQSSVPGPTPYCNPFTQVCPPIR